MPLDYASLAQRRLRAPAAGYYNQFPRVYRPDMTVAHSLLAGWSLAQVHPVVGVYRKYPAANYVPLLQATGNDGLSVFLGDQATPPTTPPSPCWTKSRVRTWPRSRVSREGAVQTITLNRPEVLNAFTRAVHVGCASAEGSARSRGARRRAHREPAAASAPVRT